MATKQGQWSSYWAFILATAGAAVGLGNIWKFPYIAGENGGGAFVLIYLVCIALIGIPLMMAEVMLGRAAGHDPYTAIRQLTKKYRAHGLWQVAGGSLVLAGFLILSYYSVIAGWATAYVLKAASGIFFEADASHINALFHQLVASPYELAFWHTLMMSMTIAIVSMGVEKGLERSVLYLFPSMLALLLVIVGYSMSTGYFAKGLSFLFYPDFNKLSSYGILSAVGHAFFTLSLATGSIMMYGAYLPARVSIPKTTVFIAIADTLIALLAGLAIFPIVFAYKLEPSAGPGLIFQTLPLAFGQMPYGSFFGMVFFMMLVFAAFTSAISLLEPSVAWCVNYFKLSRPKAAFMVGGAAWLLGFGTIFSFNWWQHLKILGFNFFDFLDNMTANYMLPLTGLIVALFAAWVATDSKKQLAITSPFLFKCWKYSLGILTPIAIILVFLNAVGILSFGSHS